MKRKRLDNRGLSLIELIVAVAILAVVVSPLLHTFVTSARTAAKSAKMGGATLAAQNVQEVIEATHMDALAESLRLDRAKTLFGADSVTVSGGAQDGEDTYEFELGGIEAGGLTFDAVVQMDANVFAAQNTVEVTQYTPMGVVFSQFREENLNPDLLAAAEFADEALLLGLTDLDTTEEFYKRRIMEREITITISEDAGRVNVDILFEYRTELNYEESYKDPETGEDKTRPAKKQLSFESRDWASGSSSVTLPSVYFFYYPNYLSKQGSFQDNITINNKNNLKLSVFLVKQDPYYAEWDQYEATYSAAITLVETGSAGADPNAAVFSNIDPKKLAFYLDWNNEAYVGHIKLSGDLVAVEAENRMYEVGITIYEHGDRSNPLYTLTASKLD